MPADLVAAIAGLGAAAAWGAGDFGGGFASKRLPVTIALLGSNVVGLGGSLAGALVRGETLPAPADAAWAATAGVLGVVGLAGLYRAIADGRMGIVAPITGILTAGIPVAVGIATAGLPGPVRLAGFALALLAIVLVSLADDGSTGRSGLLLALGAGVAFGLYGTAIGQVRVGVFGPLVVSRGVSATVMLAIVAARRTPVAASFRVGPRLLALVVLVGILDLAGNVGFLVAAQAGGLAVAAVLGSLYPVGTVVLAAVVLREPIGRVHGAGVAAAALATMLIVGAR